LGFKFGAVGAASNLGYEWGPPTCGALPTTVFDVGEVAPGASVNVFVCWDVLATDVATLQMYLQRGYSDSGPVWFSLGGEAVDLSALQDTVDAIIADAGVASDGSRDAPIPVGQTGHVGTFLVQVNEVMPVVDDEVVAYYEFNEPPATGNQYFMANVTVTHVGTTVLWGIAYDVWFKAIGEANKEYEDGCSKEIPNAARSVGDVFPGGTVTYNVCWEVSSADAGSLVMFAHPLGDTADRAWFSLQP
jgi:hypothetical protein